MRYSIPKVSPSIIFLVIVLTSGTSWAEHYEILAFGDSLTQGLKRSANGVIWAFPNPLNGARGGGYEPRLENQFTNLTKHTAFVYNWGYRGERTTGGVNRIDSVLNSRVANYLLLVEGANDLYEGISTYTTKYNLGIMIDKCRAKNITPILGTVTPNTAHPNGGIIPYLMNPKIVALSGEKNVPLADLYSALGSNWGYYNSGDGLHWSDAGDQKVAETWVTILIPFLPAQVNIVPMFQLLLL